MRIFFQSLAQTLKGVAKMVAFEIGKYIPPLVAGEARSPQCLRYVIDIKEQKENRIFE
jgi:hypothetical protein